METNDLIAKMANDGPKKIFPKPSHLTTRWTIFMALYFVSLIYYDGARSDIYIKLTQPIFLLELAAIIITTILATYAVSLLALPDCGQKSKMRFFPFILLIFVISILIYQIATTNALSLLESLRLANHLCVTHIMLYSMIPCIIMFINLRKAAPTRCCWAGAIIGLSGSSFGYLVLRIVEQSDDPSKLIIWHLLPIFLTTMLGMVIGKIALRYQWQSNK